MGHGGLRKGPRAENKPIFLSIGYSTCHWCHVMERESFENEQIAAMLNRDFVPIKVDREERPDVDRIYMTFVQATTGGGGWPMSVWLTPDLKPFLGGTYFPPDDRYGRPAFARVLERIADAWRTDREQIVDSSGEVIEQLRKQSRSRARAAGSVLHLDRTCSTAASSCSAAPSIRAAAASARRPNSPGRSRAQFPAALLRPQRRTRKRSTWC